MSSSETDVRNRPGSPPPVRRSAFLIGLILLIVCSAAAVLLALAHLGGLGLPGCRENSGCGKLAASAWATIRLGPLAWPVAYVGCAYFLSMLIAWLYKSGCMPKALRVIARIGAVASLGFLVIMLAHRTICGYCTAAHLSNLAFVALIERMPAFSSKPRPSLRRFITAFIVASVVLFAADRVIRGQARKAAEADLAASTQEIITRSERSAAHSDSTADAEPIDPAAVRPIRPTALPSRQSAVAEETLPVEAGIPRPTPAEENAAGESPEPFTGRYRIGPKNARIRLVVFTDYQCADCYKVEQQIVKIMTERSDVSLSVKHFPFNPDCNPFAPKALHPNACAAARAAEAAGRRWGPEGFWKMHQWLFERRGTFTTTRELEQGIRAMGYDPAGFTQLMMSPDVLADIRRDAEEAQRLGLFFTPMVFVNGVELRGWMAPNAVIRAVTELAATNPPPAGPEHDQPPLAKDKLLADYVQQPLLTMPADSAGWSLGGPDAAIDIVMWGDYQEPITTDADALIRRWVLGRDDSRYTYRHFPVNSDCNPKAPDRRHPLACRAALAADIAGRMGGADAFWKMHGWLMENRTAVSEETLRARFAELGLDATAAIAEMDNPAAAANIREDIADGGTFPSLRHGMPPGIFGVPMIFVNGRYVPRWKVDDRPIVDEIFTAAKKLQPKR